MKNIHRNRIRAALRFNNNEK